MKKALMCSVPRIEGHIKIISKDVLTGEERLEADCHNLVTNNCRAVLQGSRRPNGLYEYYDQWSHMAFGSDNHEPSAGDTALENLLWVLTFNSYHSIYVTDDQMEAGVTFRAIIPATTDYVGSIRQVGLYYTYGTGGNRLLMTKALLKDAEDNPITIEKTDLMQLTVDYSLVFKATAGNPGMDAFFWYWCFRRASSDWDSVQIKFGYGDASALMAFLTPLKRYVRYFNGTRILYRGASCYYNLSRYFRDTGSVIDGNTLKSTYANQRIAATAGNTHYIHGVGIGRNENLYIEGNFPDDNLMPLTTLEGMNVGVGDGDTKEFDPPIAFWVEDSDVIYLDDVAQVRNVDYTVDYYNNLADLPELYPTCMGLIIGGKLISTDSFQDPFLHRAWSGYSDRSLCYTSDAGWAWTPTDPMIIELPMEDDPAKDWSISRWYIQRRGSNGTVQYSNITIKVQYSDDNEVWTDWVTTGTVSIYNELVIDGPITTAKFWKIILNSYSDTWGANAYMTLYLAAKRVGQKIVFTEAPASGAIITMDAQIDRPLKNDKHVLDFNPVLQF